MGRSGSKSFISTQKSVRFGNLTILRKSRRLKRLFRHRSLGLLAINFKGAIIVSKTMDT